MWARLSILVALSLVVSIESSPCDDLFAFDDESGATLSAVDDSGPSVASYHFSVNDGPTTSDEVDVRVYETGKIYISSETADTEKHGVQLQLKHVREVDDDLGTYHDHKDGSDTFDHHLHFHGKGWDHQHKSKGKGKAKGGTYAPTAAPTPLNWNVLPFHTCQDSAGHNGVGGNDDVDAEVAFISDDDVQGPSDSADVDISVILVTDDDGSGVGSSTGAWHWAINDNDADGDWDVKEGDILLLLEVADYVACGQTYNGGASTETCTYKGSNFVTDRVRWEIDIKRTDHFDLDDWTLGKGKGDGKDGKDGSSNVDLSWGSYTEGTRAGTTIGLGLEVLDWAVTDDDWSTADDGDAGTGDDGPVVALDAKRKKLTITAAVADKDFQAAIWIRPYPVQGEWGEWNECGTTNPGERERTCTNPAPLYDGAYCDVGTEDEVDDTCSPSPSPGALTAASSAQVQVSVTFQSLALEQWTETMTVDFLEGVQSALSLPADAFEEFQISLSPHGGVVAVVYVTPQYAKGLTSAGVSELLMQKLAFSSEDLMTSQRSVVAIRENTTEESTEDLNPLVIAVPVAIGVLLGCVAVACFQKVKKSSAPQKDAVSKPVDNASVLQKQTGASSAERISINI